MLFRVSYKITTSQARCLKVGNKIADVIKNMFPYMYKTMTQTADLKTSKIKSPSNIDEIKKLFVSNGLF